jgi:hypothetical protein
VRLTIVLVAVLLGGSAAAWYFVSQGETVEAEHVPSFAGFQGGDAERTPEVRDVTRRATTTPGLQTTVPDAVGYDEAPAIFELEEGGFRVRVMTRKVSDPGDEGIVVQQIPRGGLTRRVNWTVTIFVGRLR